MNMMEKQRRIGTLQARWQAATKVLGEQIDLGEGQAPRDVVAEENTTWEAYRQACVEAGLCVRVDCYLTIAGHREVLCPKHRQEWQAWERRRSEL